jgi:membrane-associated phospholipid phosphatase
VVGLAVFAYFGVRGLTEGSVTTADRNARAVLRAERSLGLDVELGLQAIVNTSHVMVTLANWVYIWLHWPVLVATLIWLLVHDRAGYLWLRNAMIASGSIGIVVYALVPVTPPRLFGSYVDTVTEYSHAYRVLQPPMFVNAYAAMPSLHFGWNLLAGIVWFRLARGHWSRAAAVAMPAAMAVAVVATGNHWVLDVVVGGLFAGVGAAISTEWSRRHPESAVTGLAQRTGTDRPAPPGVRSRRLAAVGDSSGERRNGARRSGPHDRGARAGDLDTEP